MLLAFYFVAIYFHSNLHCFIAACERIIKIQIKLSHLLLPVICLDDYEISRNLYVVEK